MNISAIVRPRGIVRLPHAVLVPAAIAVLYFVYWSVSPTLYLGTVGNDALFLADGARRIAEGQVPHLDFSLPTGVLPFLSYFWAQNVFRGFSPYIGSHLIGFVLLLPILVPAASAMPNRAAALALIGLAAAAALLPYNLRTLDHGIAFYASYNRLCSALALVWLAWIFRAGQGPAWRDAAIIAYGLVLAFFLKIVLLGVILAPLAVLLVAQPRWRVRAGLGIGLALAVLGSLELTTGIVGHYVLDLVAMSAVNAGGALYFLASFVFKTLAQQILVGLLILSLLIERLGPGSRDPGTRLEALGQPLAMLAAVGGLIVLESQATGGLEFTAALGLLFAPGLLPATGDGKVKRTLFVASAALVGGLFMIAMLDNTAAIVLKRQGPGVAADWAERFLDHATVPAALEQQSGATAALWTEGLPVIEALEVQGHAYAERSAPHLYLAQWRTVDADLAELGPVDRESLGPVATLGNVDFFGLALDAEPARGLKVVHDVGRTIRPLSPQEASAYLARAQTVFAPTCTLAEAPGNGLMTEWFAPTLATEFSARVLTPCWTVHTRL